MFDCETTSLPLRDEPIDHPDQPGLVQLGAVLFDADRRERASVSLVVNAGMDVTAESAGIHGIGTGEVVALGVPERGVVGLFSRLLALSDVVVAHNLEFDMLMMVIAAARTGVGLDFGSRPLRCTMTTATPVLGLPATRKMLYAGFNGPKSPRLEECVAHFFGETLEGAHDALVDAKATARVYWKLLDMGCWKEAA